MMRKSFVLVLVLFAAGCFKVEQCSKLLPVQGEQVSLITTPAGKTGCKCVTDGVQVVVQPKRDGLFGWKRGQIWIDGAPVAEADFENRLAEAKTKAAVKGVLDRATAIGKGFLDAIRK
jgi:hypothetical protein